jgi:serine protease Do
MFGSKPAARALCVVLLLHACGAPRSAVEPAPASGTPTTPTPSGSSPGAAEAREATDQAGDWLVEPKPDLRRLTVVVRAPPPPPLATHYERLSARFRKLAPLFQAAAEGGFGSGFVVVRRDGPAGDARRVFLVSNRHVVGLATEVQVTLEGNTTPQLARVIDVDARYDLAVLAFAQEPAPFERGFALAPAPARDQDAVVASGYPGIGARPSYQVTRGFVSNERFVLEDASGETYVQHTAPIDPGSSGGPLTTPDGKLLGVNTLKIRGRENVGLAVPVGVVASALDRVLHDAKLLPPSKAEQAQAACDALLASVAAGASGVVGIERALGASLVVELGMASLPALPPPNEKWIASFIDDPTHVFLHAIAQRLTRATTEREARCTLSRSDDTQVSFTARLGGVERLLTFAPEQGRWKLTKADLGRTSGHSFLEGAEPASRKKWKPSLR